MNDAGALTRPPATEPMMELPARAPVARPPLPDATPALAVPPPPDATPAVAVRQQAVALDDETAATTTSAELPVPIEAALWVFVAKRRGTALAELRDVYGVDVQSYRGDDGMVRVRLDASSADMLACGLDALGQLIDQLINAVAVVCL